jgi:aminoglycoside phosphotransferase (APT) family kinase protein
MTTRELLASPSRRADEEALRRCLERVVPRLYAGEPSITAIERTRYTLSTSYDTHIVTVHLASGHALKMFMKDFGVSVRPKDGAKERREREIRVYQDLLAGTTLGTARYYGSVLDEARKRYWLFLEFVDGEPVGDCPLDAWAPAAGRLGRLHSYFAQRVEQLLTCDFLIRHDAEFFWSRADDALAAVARIAPHLTGHLAHVVKHYGPVVDIMASQPATLVHGGCRPSNILINVASDPRRVCIVDWEEGGIGAPLFDVAYLLDGIDPPILDRLLDAYRQEALADAMSLPNTRDTKHVVDCFRLHMTMNSLRQAVVKGYDERAVEKLLGIAHRLYQVVRRGTGLEPRTNDPDAASLRLVLERLLTDARGHPVRITSVTREPSPFATLFPAEVLSMVLQDGEHLSLFVKHLGCEQAEHPEKQRRDREVRVYEELLGAPGLPVVRYFGSRRNGTSGRRELFLEHVDDWSLEYHELRHWFNAARRLGELHAHFAARVERLAACDFLLRFDAAYFREWAARALTAVAGHSAELAARLRRVVDRYDPVTQALTRYPATLVHNDLAPKNVIAHRATDPSRICFVDWEMAGIGCGVLDLVDLKYGLDPVSDRRMCEAYRDAVAGTGLLPSRPRDIEVLFAACELHKTVYRLAFWNVWRVPADRVARWVTDAEQLASRVGGRLGPRDEACPHAPTSRGPPA